MPIDRHIGLVAALVPSLVAIGQAQPAPPPIRVRITSQVARAVGTLDGMSRDTAFILEPSGIRLGISLNAATEIEVSQGRTNRLGKGALYGTIAGITLGGLRYAGGCNRGACPDPFGSVVVYAVTGLTIGSIAGAMARTERWEPTTVETLAAAKRSGVSILAPPARRGHTATGLLAGVGVGAATTLVLVQRDGFESSGFDARPVVIAAGVLGGGALGAIVGSLIRTTRSPAPRAAMQVRVSPTGLLTVGASFPAPAMRLYLRPSVK